MGNLVRALHVAELPALDKLAKDRAGSLTVLAVSQDLDSAGSTGGGGTDAKVAAFLKQRAPGLAPWRDGENNLAFHYNAQTLPTTIYYDAQGREVWRFTGAREWTSGETAKLLDEALTRHETVAPDGRSGLIARLTSCQIGQMDRAMRNFTEDQILFRDAYRKFLEAEIAPAWRNGKI